MIGQLLIARPVIAVVLGKAAIFRCGLEWAWSGQYEVDFGLISASVYQRSRNSCCRIVREGERGGVSGAQWSGGQGCFIGHFSIGSASLNKIPNFVVGQVFSYLALEATNFFIVQMFRL